MIGAQLYVAVIIYVGYNSIIRRSLFPLFQRIKLLVYRIENSVVRVVLWFNEVTARDKVVISIQLSRDGISEGH